MQTWDIAVRSVQLLRRWWALIVVAGLASGACATLLLSSQPPQYVARTTLMVGTNLRSPNPSDTSSNVSLTLASFYAEMARRTPITGPVVERLHLPFSADVLNEKLVSTRVIPQAQLIEIAVLDSDAARAAAVANAIAGELVQFSPTSPDKLEEQRRFAQAQISDLEAKIEQTDGRIKALNEQLLQMTSAGEIAEAQQRLRELEALKGSDQSTYSGMLGNLNDASLNTLSVFEPAEPPTLQVPRRIFPAALLALMLGLAIGVAAAWVLEDVDDRWSRGRKPRFLAGERVLSTLVDGGDGAQRHGARGKQALALRSEIVMELGRKSRSTVLITSAHASTLRSRLSVELAQLMAESGQRVLLVDANLGSVSLARMVGGDGDGLQRLLAEPNTPLATLTRPTDSSHLLLLPSAADAGGPLVPTLRWPDVVVAVEADRATEMVIFDGPAMLDGPDGTLVAPQVGSVLLVVDPATERVSDTRRALQRLYESNASVLGIVLLSSPPAMGWRGRPRRHAEGAAPVAG